MNTKHSLIGSLALGAAALALSTSATGVQISANTEVQCFGVNGCKGQSDCKTATSECKGLNDCKGQGFKGKVAQACLDAGGFIDNRTR